MKILNFACAGFAAVILAASGCRSTTSGNPDSKLEDLGEHQGYTVYVWPKDEDMKANARNYDALGAQMEEYGQYVGTLLHRDARGRSEYAWRNGARYERISEVYDAHRVSMDAYCAAVKEHFLAFLPVGEGASRSDYCQYGNCGEGSHVGACLAYGYGFKGDEIRRCESENDHVFSMVKHPTKGWCILDRWDIIGRFTCGVDWDKAKRQVTLDGQATSSDWFQKVTCKMITEPF